MSVRINSAILIRFVIPVFLTLFAQNLSAQTASVAEAKAVLDLTVFKPIDPVGNVEKTVAVQFYQAKGEVDKIAKKVAAALIEKKFKQLDGAIFQSEYCTATFAKSGFHFNLSVMPSEPGIAQVSLTNIGNVDFRKLPIAKLGKEVFVQPSSAIFNCKGSVDEIKESCRSVLEKDNWHWFGETTVSFYMRKNAIRIQVMCSESPQDKGITMVQISPEQMSSTLPVIPDLVRIDYSERTGRLDGDSKLSISDLNTQLRNALMKGGWKPTTEAPIKVDFRETTIFRNAEQELVELAIYQFDDLSRFEIQYMTAEQVAEENQRAEAMAKKAEAKMAAEQDRLKNPVTISIEALESAKVKDSKPQIVEFSAQSGQGRTIMTKWLAKQEASGWTVETTIATKETGDFTLTKDAKKLSVTYIDPGFIPAEITIRTGEGFKLEFKREK